MINFPRIFYPRSQPILALRVQTQQARRMIGIWVIVVPSLFEREGNGHSSRQQQSVEDAPSDHASPQHLLKIIYGRYSGICSSLPK
jgi:hypothetical protein